jgi:hypothetical protein
MARRRRGQGAGLFEQRLRSVEAVVQNQDNREHDLLDSDDYYQFEGGPGGGRGEPEGRRAQRSITTIIPGRSAR